MPCSWKYADMKSVWRWEQQKAKVCSSACFRYCLEDVLGAFLRGDGVGQGLFFEAAAPWDVGVVDFVGNADIAKRCEALALDAFEGYCQVDE